MSHMRWGGGRSPGLSLWGRWGPIPTAQVWANPRPPRPLSALKSERGGFSHVSSLKAAPGQGAGPRSSGHPHRAPGHGATPSPRPPTPGHPLLRTSLLSQEAAVEACRSNGSLKDAAASDGAVTGPRAGTFTCCRGRRVASAALAPPLGALLPAEHLRLWTSLPSLWTKV